MLEKHTNNLNTENIKEYHKGYLKFAQCQILANKMQFPEMFWHLHV